MVLSERYEIIEKIGSGGMAIVFLGKDKKLERYVTIKVLREEYVGDEDFISRFRSEACSAARLSHPNIVRVYDVGQDGSIYYIVMEYVHGDTLKKAIKEKAPFDTKSTINVAIQMASALSHAHKNHIVHRDIKPQNILVGTDGIIKVTDFGIARAATASTMTTTANAAGSVHYFSPEQARGGYVDEKSDIYSLGITMFEMVAGQVPFQGNNSVAIALKHINDELPDIRQFNPNVSKSLEGIIRKATQKKADERYPNIDLMLDDLLKARTDSNGSFLQEASTAKANEETTEKKELDFISNVGEKKPKPKIDPAIAVASTQKAKTDNLPKSISANEKKENFLNKIKVSKDDSFEKEYEANPFQKSGGETKPMAKRRNPKLESEYSSEIEKSQERKVIIAAIITALIIIFGISAFGIHLLGGTGALFGGSKEVSVPSFEGQTFTYAESVAEELGLKLVKEGEDYSKFYAENYVIDQSVPEGKKVKKGTEIGVKISLGLSSEDMPNVIGKSEKAAIERIENLVGAKVKVEYVFDDEIAVGTVVDQSPSSGSKITAESAIQIMVSKGAESKPIAVPNVEGLPEAQAKSSLTALGFVIGSVTPAESSQVPKGNVITQTVPAGQELAKGSVVGLVISSGPPAKEETPATENTDTTSSDNQSSTPPAENEASSTRMFSVSAPSGAEGTLQVKIIKKGSDGTKVVMNSAKDASEFPFIVSVTGSGTAKVECYIDGAQQWSESVNFSEGGY